MSPNDFRVLAGTTIAITGATSGIGRQTARQLVSHGANVTLLGRRKDRLDDLVQELGSAQAEAVAGDVRRPADNQRMVAAAVERFGRLDSLIANAGLGLYGGIMDNSDDELAHMVETNLLGTVWSVRAAIPAMTAGGDIIIVSSVAGLRGGANEAVYAATKFGQVGLAGAIDRELRTTGIRVSTICPAAVATEFAIGHGRTEGDTWLDEVLTADDIASAIVYALSQPRRMRTQTWSMWSMVEGS